MRWTLEFRQRKDASRIPGHSPYMKMYVVMKCLCKGISPDNIDDYTRMDASTTYYYIKKFCDTIMFGFNAEYIRRPTVNDVKCLMKENAARGFPGMLGSLDCMHWGWRVCPQDEAGTHTGHKSYPTCVLEAVASYYRWFWHGYFEVGGSSNDLNFLKSSNLFDNNLNVQAYGAPSDIPILELFNKYQMAKRKDVEQAFGTLQNPPHAPIVRYLRQTSDALQNPVLHERLRTDLTGHIWERHGQGLRDGEIPGDAIDNELDSGEDTDEVDVDQDHYDPE
ncbi:uncharacterized protein LOC113316296 [Papaver somniferum]|uniref:uncharacterized protein LOC113316296 n=1 Tax=Papaver somniferum TaxID=3469 RepID=UPI000E704D44|nr:uncharacterized protein LOC113316296 [Papaver somniferum]